MNRNAMDDFHRDITHRILRRDDCRIVLTATLRDRFHDIEVEVVADIETLTIGSAAADFRRSPTRYCSNVSARLAGLIGFPIGNGLNRKLVEVLGGGEGCGNIRNLLLGLLPLAMNVRASAGIVEDRKVLESIHEKSRGTCAGFPGEVER